MLNKSMALLVAVLALVFGTGCNTVTFSDDIDLELDFELTRSDDLHLPYVAGTEVTISASDGRSDEEADSWTLVSSNKAVLSIDSQAHNSANCTANNPGTATIMAYDADGDVVGEVEIEVAAPNRLELVPHGPMIIGRGGAVQDIHILQGGTATYLVRYFRGDLPLYGNGVLSAVNNELATARNLTTFLFENREWLQIDAVGQGSNMLGLEANGAHLLDVPLTVVGSAAITSFELIDDERYEEPEHGDLRTVLALARDGLSRPIYGIEVSWDLDGDGVAGTGDLFRYEYNVDASKVLGGTLGELRAEVSIHAVSGYVFSSNKLGCSMSRPQGEAPPALAFLLASLAAAACLRRRGG